MGATFVKLGQLLSTRVDLLGPEWIAELSKLQSRVPATDYSAIHAQIVEDLGAGPEVVFLTFDRVPLAAASIAQVHRARPADGTEAVVKTRRAGLRPVIDADLRLLRRAARAIEVHNPELPVTKIDSQERIAGVSRYGADPQGSRCECAVVVSDEWQGRGLGVRLMQHLIEVATSRGIQVMYSLDSAENSAMSDLARLFSRRTDPDDATQVIHELSLQPLAA